MSFSDSVCRDLAVADGSRSGASDYEGLLELACGSGVRDQPAPDAFGDLARRCFWHLGRVLAVPAGPVSSSCGLPDQFDTVCRPTSLLQTDADVGWESRHDFDASDVASLV